jgi:hypothetical protein
VPGAVDQPAQAATPLPFDGLRFRWQGAGQ